MRESERVSDPPAAGSAPTLSVIISHNALIKWFEKSNLPRNRQLTVSISNSKQQVDDSVGKLTFSKHLINTLCEISQVLYLLSTPTVGGHSLSHAAFHTHTHTRTHTHTPSAPRHIGMCAPRAPLSAAGSNVRKHSTLQGYLAHKKQPPPLDHHRALEIVLLKGPGGERCVLWGRYPCICSCVTCEEWDLLSWLVRSLLC